MIASRVESGGRFVSLRSSGSRAYGERLKAEEVGDMVGNAVYMTEIYRHEIRGADKDVRERARQLPRPAPRRYTNDVGRYPSTAAARRGGPASAC